MSQKDNLFRVAVVSLNAGYRDFVFFVTTDNTSDFNAIADTAMAALQSMCTDLNVSKLWSVKGVVFLGKTVSTGEPVGDYSMDGFCATEVTSTAVN